MPDMQKWTLAIIGLALVSVAAVSSTFAITGHPAAVTTECQIEDADGAKTDQACVSVSSGSRIFLTRLSVHCDGSTTNPTNLAVGFGASTLPARAHTGSVGTVLGFDGVPAGGGTTIGNGGGLIGIGADGEDLRYTNEDPAGGACSVEATYYTAP